MDEYLNVEFYFYLRLKFLIFLMKILKEYRNIPNDFPINLIVLDSQKFLYHQFVELNMIVKIIGLIFLILNYFYLNHSRNSIDQMNVEINVLDWVIHIGFEELYLMLIVMEDVWLIE
jgi:hypothetical protein